METLIRDLRHALRTLTRSPLFVAVAALTLALGIGVNATIFTFVNAVLLRPLPVKDPGSLMQVYSSWQEETYSTTSYPDYLALAEQNDVFTGLVGHSLGIASLQHGGKSEIQVGEIVTGNYFEVLGVDADYGRPLSAADDRPSSPNVVVLGHGTWQQRFGGDPAVVGRSVRISGESYEVVGVAPESFPGLMPGLASDFWVTVSRRGDVEAAGQINAVPGETGPLLERRGYRWLSMKGRLRPGVAPAEARAQLETLMARLAQEHPTTNKDITAVALPASEVRFHPDIDRVLGPVAMVLLGAVGLVLLIVCANLANMLLARAQGRRKEMAVRLALGAGRGRLVRQLLTEGVVLSGLGGALAVVLAYWTNRLILAYQPPIPFSVQFDMGVDGRVLAFTALVAMGSALAFALVPALQASRPDLVPALKDGAMTSDGAPRFLSLRNVLVMAQVAVSIVLLVAGGLLLRAVGKANAVDVGLDAERVAVVQMDLGMNGYEGEAAQTFFRTLEERVEALPGVESAAYAERVPFDINLYMQDIYPDSLELDAEHPGFPIDVTWADAGYFETLGVPVLWGRSFTDADVAGSPWVAVVNEAMARRFWKEGNIVGRQIRRGLASSKPYEIVGVVRDYKVRTVGEEPRPMVHFARAQQPEEHAYLLVRSSGGDAAALLPQVRQVALGLDSDLAFAEATTLAGKASVSLYPVRMGAVLLGFFGLLALVLASVGLYGVIAYSVSRRDREIGLRMAMGARPRDVVRLVVGGGMTLVVVGMAVGLALAAIGSRVLEGVLYGTSALDPLAFGGAALVLVAVAFLANVLPAVRAARLDPLAALRQD